MESARREGMEKAGETGADAPSFGIAGMHESHARKLEMPTLPPVDTRAGTDLIVYSRAEVDAARHRVLPASDFVVVHLRVTP